jgi:hypothetical protein
LFIPDPDFLPIPDPDIPDPDIPDPDFFTHPGSQIQGFKKAPDPGSATLKKFAEQKVY